MDDHITTPETDAIITEWENLVGGEGILREYVEVMLLESHARLEGERDEARRLAETYRDNDHDLTLQNSINNPLKPLLPWENRQ